MGVGLESSLVRTALVVALVGTAFAEGLCGEFARGGDQPLTSPSAEVAGPGVPLDQPTTIDLSSALRLAGVQNLQIVVAQQRVEAAVAVQQLAAAQILPNLNFGTNYDSQSGVVQSPTRPDPRAQPQRPLRGGRRQAVGSGTVQIPGVQYNINISAAIFNYLVTRQITDAVAIRPAGRRQSSAAQCRVGVRRTAPHDVPT